MAILKIPITASPLDQRVRVLINGERFSFRFIWNNTLQFWSMFISTDTETLVSGSNLTGGSELINQFNTPIRNMYAINLTDNASELVLEDTGVSSILIITSDEDIQLIEEEQGV